MLCFIVSMVTTATWADTERPSVLLLQKAQVDAPWNRSFVDSFQQRFYARYPQGKLHVEYIDVATLRPSTRAALKQFIAGKYTDIKIDAVIYDGTAGLSFLQSGSSFKPQAGHFVLTYAMDSAPSSLLVNTFQLALPNDYKHLIRDALSLSKAEKIFVVYDPINALRLANPQKLKAGILEMRLGAKVEFVGFTTLNETLTRINSYSGKAAVVLAPVMVKTNTISLFPAQISKAFAAETSFPVFVHWETMLNNQVTGGYVVSADLVAQEFLDGVTAYLRGRAPNMRPSKVYVGKYNDAKLNKLGLNINSLSESSLVYNQSVDPIDLYHTELATGVAAFCLLLFFSAIVINRNRLLRKQQSILAESEERLINVNERLNVATLVTQLGIWEYVIESESLAWDRWMFIHHDKDTHVFKPTLKTWLATLPERDAEGLNSQMQEAIVRGRELSMQYSVKLNNSQVKHLSIHAEAILNMDNKPIKLVGTVLNITQQVSQKQQFQLEKEKALASEKAKSLFIASMSHEIRTPMNAILGASDLLEKSDLTNKQSEYLSIVKSSASSMQRIVSDLLELGRIENGKIKIERYSFDINELIQTSLANFHAEILKKGLKLKCVIDNNLPKVLMSDPLRIKQVLLNLIDNALKFTEQGYVELKVSFKPYRKLGDTADGLQGTLTFTVNDSGIGIQLDAHTRIFEKFEQSNQETFRKYGGTGLGLSISQEIANLLDGEITLTSEPGEGSQFTFRLPVRIGNNDRVESPSLMQEDTLDNNEVTAAVAPNLRGKTGLIVDDIETNRMILQQILLETGLSVQFAENGQEAVHLFHSQQLDFILMDVLMPVMDGILATTIIRASDAGINQPSIPIISFTAQEIAGDRELCLDAGMDAYLTKPINRQKLFSTIKSLVH